VIDRQHSRQARWVVMPTEPQNSAIDLVAQRLSRQFVHLNTELVARVVWDTYRHYDEHPNRDVVPILVQDAARDRLRVIPTTGRPAR
jgi:hypothetical protein